MTSESIQFRGAPRTKNGVPIRIEATPVPNVYEAGRVIPIYRVCPDASYWSVYRPRGCGSRIALVQIEADDNLIFGAAGSRRLMACIIRPSIRRPTYQGRSSLLRPFWEWIVRYNHGTPKNNAAAGSLVRMINRYEHIYTLSKYMYYTIYIEKQHKTYVCIYNPCIHVGLCMDQN